MKKPGGLATGLRQREESIMSNGFIKVANGRFYGEIRTMRVFLPFRLEPNSEARGESSPSHIVEAKSPMGHIFQAGVAWQRTIQRGDSVGKTMFSITIQDPEFGDQPLNFSAFPGGPDGQLTLSLDRKRNVQTASPKGEQEGDNGAFDMPAAA